MFYIEEGHLTGPGDSHQWYLYLAAGRVLDVLVQSQAPDTHLHLYRGPDCAVLAASGTTMLHYRSTHDETLILAVHAHTAGGDYVIENVDYEQPPLHSLGDIHP